jgi:DNA-binding NtrC family response regulator
MPVMDGMQLLHVMHERGLSPAVVVLTGYGTIESAVEAMKLGAADYLIKDARPQEVLVTVERVLKLDALRRENARLRQEIDRLQGFGELIGESAAMKAIYRVIGTVSENKSTVLISGESGTGKELVARTIHQRGPLAPRPFVAINCAGLSETLLDSQLFGHRRGAFTGAVNDHDGVFRAAEGGTLFLDEVAEIPLSLQAKFLRAVEQREVTPLGASLPVPVDVRIIAATNRDLEAEARTGRFRTDLFYRLDVVHMELPPLRARLEDVPLLVEHFLERFSRQYQVAPKRVAAEATDRLRAHTWPGNVRELQNAIERAFALSVADTITLDDLPPALRERESPAAEAPGELPTLEQTERRLFAAALRKSGGNKNEAARLLGIDRQRLYRKIEKYGLG